jgi:hypothetical protein
VIEKSAYYSNAPWAQRDRAQEWAAEAYLELKHPFRVHNVYHDPSWLERFSESHPPQIDALRADIESGRKQLELRRVDDIERLLSSKRYQVGRAFLKQMAPVDHVLREVLRRHPRFLPFARKVFSRMRSFSS